MKKTLLFLWIRIFIVLALSSVSLAMAETISRIEVSGNLHVDSQTIRNSAGLNVGMEITNLDIDKATKRIFSMGIFSDVAIHLDGPILVIHVVEDKMIRKISFQGNKKIKDIDLERMIVLKVHRSFEPSILESDKQVIHDAYLHLGFHEVSVSSSTVNLGQGYVNVLFKINEGKRSGISSIIFKGNRAFSVSRLRDVIRSKRSNLLNWLTGGDIYSEERLAEDRETLHRFYNDHGYADFHLIASDAGLNPENDTYKITFSFDEGSLYHISDINIDTSMIGIHSDFLRKILKIHEGDVYNAKKIEDSLLALENRISDLGYSFARFEVLTSRDFVNHKISILYRVKQSSQTYVERIEIHGNNKTRDEVIRREFDMSEGDSFSPIRIKRAQHRLESLGFFQRVNISTAPGSDVDQIILVVDVLEQPTGDFSVGGGYTTGGESPGLSLEASITDHNFLGRGQYLRFGLGGGQQASRNYSFSFTEPYFLGYRLSSGFDVFHQTYRMNDDYDVRQTGGMIRFRIPITDEVEGSLAYNYLEEKYDLGQISDNDDLRELYDRYSGAVIEAAKNSPWRRSSLIYGMVYNSIDNMENPHSGIFINVNQEYAGLGGNADFLKTSGKSIFYQTLLDQYDLVGFFRGGFGSIYRTGKDGIRIFDTFKSNLDIIRGFKFNGIGPMQTSSNGNIYFLGGKNYMNSTAELQFPMPILPSNFGMRAAFFLDAATLYGNDYQPKIPDLEGPVMNKDSFWRASIGMSLMWASPFGPLRFDYAFPLRKEEGDRVQNFNFGVSTKF